MSPEPRLILVVGVAGSGKSTVARALARELGAAYLDKDRLANRFTEALLALAGEEPGARDGSEFYRERIMPLEYASLLDVAADVLTAGSPVVLDAPFGAYFDDPDYVTRNLSARGVRPAVYLVRVSAAQDVTRRRLLERGSERDAWKLSHWNQFWAAQTVPMWEGVARLEYDNSGPIDLDSLIARIGAGGDG